MYNDENDNLFDEALLELAIAIKRNSDLVRENTELRKKLEEKNYGKTKQKTEQSQHK